MSLTRIRPILCPLAISLVCIILSLSPDSWQNALQYQRNAIQAGEVWRLITAHLTHLNTPHLLMNILGLWLIWLLFFTRQALTPLCLYQLPPIMLGTVFGLFLFSHEVTWYRGLSGALHGLLALALLRQWHTQRLTGALLLILFSAKIAWEQLSGAVPGSEAWIGGQVIVDSHLYGAISGGLIWLLEYSHSLIKKREVIG
jgi:rhomboid family GlyGly-CTERM serine protease